VISDPEIIQPIHNEMREKNRGAAEPGESVLWDPVEFFLEQNKLEVSPHLRVLQRKVVDAEKQLNLVNWRLGKEKRQEREDTHIPRPELNRNAEDELIHYTVARLHVQNEKIKTTEFESKTKKKDLQSLKEDVEQLGNELAKLMEKLKERSDDDAKLLQTQVSDKERDKSEKERQRKIKETEIAKLQEKREKHTRKKLAYEQFLANIHKAITTSSLATQKDELEILLDSLQEHISKAKATTLATLRAEAKQEIDVKKLIDMSNKRLEELAEVPPELRIEKTDPRHDIFSKIWGMVSENLTLRQQLNQNMEVLNEYTAKKQPKSLDTKRPPPLEEVFSWNLQRSDKELIDDRPLLEKISVQPENYKPIALPRQIELASNPKEPSSH
jgi:hypothetical protein